MNESLEGLIVERTRDLLDLILQNNYSPMGCARITKLAREISALYERRGL